MTAASDPAIGRVDITPSDSTDISTGTNKTPMRGLYVGTTGNVSAVMADGTTGIFYNLAAGVIHPLRLKRVNLTGTTASNLAAVY